MKGFTFSAVCAITYRMATEWCTLHLPMYGRLWRTCAACTHTSTLRPYEARTSWFEVRRRLLRVQASEKREQCRGVRLNKCMLIELMCCVGALLGCCTCVCSTLIMTQNRRQVAVGRTRGATACDVVHCIIILLCIIFRGPCTKMTAARPLHAMCCTQRLVFFSRGQAVGLQRLKNFPSDELQGWVGASCFGCTLEWGVAYSVGVRTFGVLLHFSLSQHHMRWGAWWW